jgi:hypothetical protein
VLPDSVRCLVFDQEEVTVAWAGDETGHIRVLDFDEGGNRLLQVGAPGGGVGWGRGGGGARPCVAGGWARLPALRARGLPCGVQPRH